MKKKKSSKFANYINGIIKQEKLKKRDVVREIGIYETSFSRTLAGEIKKPMAVAVIRAVNKLACREAANEAEAFALLGLKNASESYSTKFIGAGVQVVVEADNFSADESAEIVRDLRFAFEITLRRLMK